jgi:N-acetylmuramoyl-L-alanine amidase
MTQSAQTHSHPSSTASFAWTGLGRSATRGLILVMTILAGCQMDADTDLPPVRLSPPVVLTPEPAPAYHPAAVATAARPIRQPVPQAVSSRVTPELSSGVPTSWVPRVPANHWTWIIIHHSDSAYGSAAIIDKWHRDRGFDELGYHFVIGNGTNSGDGQIEVGPRWTKQKWGAHDNALDNRYNTNGIGICLVGNFNDTRPTPKQIHSLVRLVVYLMRKYDIPADRVLGHGDTKVTQCPGRYLNVASIRNQAERIVAQGDSSNSPDQYAESR